MKAITCTQCGATLDRVSERSLIIECEYCGARIMMPGREEREEKVKPRLLVVVEPPELELRPEPVVSPAKIGVAVAFALIIPLMIFVFAVIRRPPPSPVQASSTPYTYSSPYPSGTPSSWSWSASANTSDKPLPVVNYQPRVSWEGSNDMEHFEDPQVDLSSVSDLTTEEVLKTVFKNRVVKLRVVINTEGEIDDVETISGHPILVAAATESARRSVFNSRSKPTKRVLTYTFRVLKD